MEETKKGRLLIIDDSEMNVVILTRILSPDYKILVAKNGRAGIETAVNYLPDVIILDIIMPGMDGYETITELKSLDQTRNIPVIFISGLSSSEDEEKGLILGAADYIIKPFSEAVVKLRVRHQIQLQNYIRTIENLLMTDQLTKIPNRRSFDERLLMEWNRAQRKMSQVSILIIDIDHFKRYNDTYGHPQGDVALQTVAGIFSKALWRPGDFAARWGGEEFIVLLPDTDLDGALAVGEKIRHSVEYAEIRDENGQLTTPVTVSVGVNTVIPTDDGVNSIKDFIHFADDALYAAKRDGRNRVCKYYKGTISGE